MSLEVRTELHANESCVSLSGEILVLLLYICLRAMRFLLLFLLALDLNVLQYGTSHDRRHVLESR